MYLPNNPVILLSLVNNQLRDNYADLNSFCEENDCSKNEICMPLTRLGYSYDPEINQFKLSD